MRKLKKRKIIVISILLLLIIGLAVPQNFIIPVDNADKNSYNVKSYWYYPWGKSGTHKGVDIFAREGTDVNSSTHGLVVYRGEIERGGKVVLILGPKWRLHYYAHLKDIETTLLS